MLAKFAVVFALSAFAVAKPAISEPIGSTTWAAGEPQVVTWDDDGTPPTLAEFGPSRISIYVGNSQQQTLLQTITPSLDLSTAGSVEFTPDPTIGPNSNQYFIRIESISLKDTATPTIPALAFSAKFTMTGMTGVFSPEIQAQINGASTAPVGPTNGTSTVPRTTSAVAATPPAAAPPNVTSSTSSTAKPTSAAATGTAGANAAKPSSGATPLSHSAFVAVAAVAAAIVATLY